MANPTKIIWRAPTLNTDGTPIDYALDYELGVVEGSAVTPVAVFPGSLNPDGTYEQPLSAFGPGSHTIVLRALNRNQPDLRSVWTNPVTFVVSTETPQPPLDFAVA